MALVRCSAFHAQKDLSMKLNVAMLMAALVLSGTALVQSSGPSAGGQAKNGQGATTTGLALNNDRSGNSGPPVEQVAKPGTGAVGNTIDVNRAPKGDRRGEHFP
ncbi:hypothetical protein [Bradyrhizobium genosp. P]|uniref:hypothetical protein n=1 Tax=Bradyrhizobium genosp. P TaxID=83641 RepID=UPI003CF05C2E